MWHLNVPFSSVDVLCVIKDRNVGFLHANLLSFLLLLLFVRLTVQQATATRCVALKQLALCASDSATGYSLDTMPKKSALQRQRHEHCSAMRQLQLASRSKEDKADSDTNPSPQASVSAVSDLASTSTVAASRPSLPLLIPPPPSGASSSIFVNTTRFHSLFDNLVCGRCKRQVTVNVTDKWLDAECSVLCSCVTERTATPSTVTHEGKALTKTNIALVLYSLTHNLGFRGFQVLSAVMERPAMHSIA